MEGLDLTVCAPPFVSQSKRVWQHVLAALERARAIPAP